MTINATLLTAITAISQAIVALFSFLMSVYKDSTDKNEKKKQNIDSSQKKIDDICDNGSINELIDSTLDMKKTRKQ